MTAVQDSLTILKELSEQCPDRSYYHEIKDSVDDGELIITAGKLVSIKDISLFVDNGSISEERIDLYERLYSALKRNVSGVQFSTKQIGLIMNIGKEEGTSGGFEEIISYINRQRIASQDEIDWWVTYFESQLDQPVKLDDLTGKYKVLEMDDGLATIGLIVPSEYAEQEKLKLNENYKFFVKKTSFTEKNYVIAYEKSIPFYEPHKLVQIGKVS